MSKLNPFKKKEPAPQQTPDKQNSPQPKTKSVARALETLVLKSNVTVTHQRMHEGDKHNSDIYRVKDKKVVDVHFDGDTTIYIFKDGVENNFEKVSNASGTQGLDKIINALRAAGAVFDHYSEDLAYGQLE